MTVLYCIVVKPVERIDREKFDGIMGILYSKITKARSFSLFLNLFCCMLLLLCIIYFHKIIHTNFKDWFLIFYQQLLKKDRSAKLQFEEMMLELYLWLDNFIAMLLEEYEWWASMEQFYSLYMLPIAFMILTFMPINYGPDNFVMNLLKLYYI